MKPNTLLHIAIPHEEQQKAIFDNDVTIRHLISFIRDADRLYDLIRVDLARGELEGWFLVTDCVFLQLLRAGAFRDSRMILEVYSLMPPEQQLVQTDHPDNSEEGHSYLLPMPRQSDEAKEK